MMLSRLLLAAMLALPVAAMAEDVDMVAMFATADQNGRTGLARKTKPVDARPATPGEIIVTVIAGEGVETRSKPAEDRDCPSSNDWEQPR